VQIPHKKFQFYIDTRSDLYDFLKHLADGEVANFDTHEFVPGAVYLIGSHHMSVHHQRIRHVINDKISHVVLEHVREGGQSMHYQFATQYLPVEDLVLDKKLPVIAGGATDPRYQQLIFDNFLIRMHLQQENKKIESQTDQIFSKTTKPYKFLFLNGRARDHRKYLIEQFKLNKLIDQSIWSNLENYPSAAHNNLTLNYNGNNLVGQPLGLTYLPARYEYPLNDLISLANPTEYAKFKLFKNQWQDGTIYAPPYIDTYFSLVTETEFHHPYSFRTEKIWKPIMAGHPWICVSSCGFYQDLKNLGFKTFDHLIDETFDQIVDSQQRIERVTRVIEDLCQQDLSKFLDEAKQTCKYNQQHFLELYSKVLKDLPNQFVQFINQSFQLNE
jgi:hypothetical protein